MASTMSAVFAESGFSSTRSSLCDVLRSLIVSNIEHFESDTSEIGRRFRKTFGQFLDHLNAVETQANEVSRTAHLFDLDSETPGNGYRSIVAVVDSCVVQSIRLCRSVCIHRSSFLFRKRHYFKELVAYADMMGCLKVILHHILTLRAESEPGSLFSSSIHSPEEILLQAENIDTTCFYGRGLGFQFCESMRKPLKFISLMMATFSDAYYNTGGIVTRTASSLVSCGKYAYNPEKRAKRIVEVARKASVDFCKSFWLLQEIDFLQQVPGIMCVPLLVNKVLQLQLKQIKLPRADGTFPEIPLPSSHLPTAPVICRLLSASVREGQLDSNDNLKQPYKVMPPSPYLIIQCHGGGFVAQSSKSHETYLRDWATHLDVPILCIDYSLAPEAPYPRPLEECFYAYCWAVENSHLLGSTAERICLVGDSAGGNLMMGVTIKAIELGIRKPDGLLAIYTPVLIDFLPSPSRLLCLMDPLLPFGFMMRCLKAYAGHPLNSSESCDHHKQEQSSSESIGLASISSSVNSSTVSTPKRQLHLTSDGQKVLNDSIGSKMTQSLGVDEEYVHLTGPTTNCALELNDDLHHKVSNSIPCAPLKANSKMSSDSESFEEVTAAELHILEARSAGSVDKNVAETHACLNSEEIKNSEAVSVDSVKEQTAEVESVPESKTKGNDYVSEFMDWYILDVDNASNSAVLHSESTDSEENIVFEMPIHFSLRLTEKVGKVTDTLLNGISDYLPGRKNSDVTRKVAIPKSKSNEGIFADRSLDGSGSLRALMEEFKQFTVNNEDPYLSPYLVSDDILQQFPPLNFLTVSLDPCLDDSVMFSKRLRKLSKEIHIDILDGLPHGFLSFGLVSKDAHDGSKLCIQRLKELLHIPAEGLTA